MQWVDLAVLSKTRYYYRKLRQITNSALLHLYKPRHYNKISPKKDISNFFFLEHKLCHKIPPNNTISIHYVWLQNFVGVEKEKSDFVINIGVTSTVFVLRTEGLPEVLPCFGPKSTPIIPRGQRGSEKKTKTFAHSVMVILKSRY